jgi:calcineurin-like phosphoesterase
VNVIFVGDITGPAATSYVAGRLPALRREHAIDLVVANADNVAVTGPHPRNGFGMTVELVDLLLRSGVDVVTSGSHAWDGPEADRVLAKPRVLRPANVPDRRPGHGLYEATVSGERVAVLTLANTPVIPDLLPIYPFWQAQRPTGTVVIHHVGGCWETRLFAMAIDGQAAAVLGTFGHEATRHQYVLPNGTAFVPDVGMTGPLGFGGAGHDLRHFVAEFKGEDSASLPPFELANTPQRLEAVRLRIEQGKTMAIEPVD